MVICLGLLVFYAFTDVRELLYAAIGVGLISLLSSWIALKISWLWMKLAEGMGWIMSKVILTIVFYIFLFPIAMLQRVFTKNDSLKLKKSSGDSYFVERNHTYEAKDLENTW